jgi:hypothetical protein
MATQANITAREWALNGIKGNKWLHPGSYSLFANNVRHSVRKNCRLGAD